MNRARKLPQRKAQNSKSKFKTTEHTLLNSIVNFYKSSCTAPIPEPWCSIVNRHTFTHWPLDIAHDETVLIVQKLHAHLRHLSSGPGASNHLHNNSQLHGGILRDTKSHFRRHTPHTSERRTVQQAKENQKPPLRPHTKTALSPTKRT